VVFSDTKRNFDRPDVDEHYILFQYSEDEEEEIDANYCYIESDDSSIVGFYKKLDAKLFPNRLYLDLKKYGIIEIKFEANKKELRDLKQTLEALFSGLGKFEVMK
jgi:hypothetical protein